MTIYAGCSDKGPRHFCQTGGADDPKVTTSQRANAALEEYWHQRAAGRSRAGDSIPGGEKIIAQRTRDACWHDSVHLDHVSYQAQQGQASAGAEAIVAEIEDKERTRTRGIPGFTGRQPAPGQSRPPPPAPDTSSWVAVNAFDERRPRVKGIPGYTGHQPPAGQHSTAHQGIPQLCMLPDADQAEAALQQCLCRPDKQQQAMRESTSDFCINRKRDSSDYADQKQQHLCWQADCHKQRQHSAAAAAQAPRFFINCVELPAEELPSTAASDAAAAYCRPSAVCAPATAIAQPADPVSAGPCWRGAALHDAKPVSAQVAVKDSGGVRPFTCPGVQGTLCAHHSPLMVSIPMLPHDAATHQVADRINRPTTYASSFHPAALEHMRRLQIGGRPASAAGLAPQQAGSSKAASGWRPHI
eukprot:gene2302-biopygen3841